MNSPLLTPKGTWQRVGAYNMDQYLGKLSCYNRRRIAKCATPIKNRLGYRRLFKNVVAQFIGQTGLINQATTKIWR